MIKKLKNALEIAQWRLCVGCGACAYICPEENIRLVNILNNGIRPIYDPTNCSACGKCVDVCPGYRTIKEYPEKGIEIIQELKKSWGTILEIWEGYASDPDIRFNSSSGGLASALALYCIEKKGMHGVLHITADPESPLSNKTILSRNRIDILSSTGSRYSPASPCSELNLIESAPEPCAFIGKPCDVAGLRKSMSMKQGLAKNVGAVIGIFCAGTPSTLGTIDLLKNFHIHAEDVGGLGYRGKGWPGMFSVLSRNNTFPPKTLSYKASWGFINAYRPFRCYLCPDSTAELADISCGDPWYRNREESEPGYSLALIRTKKGRQLFYEAREAGYITVEPAAPGVLSLSQREMPLKRGAVWGRVLTMKAFGIPAPEYRGFSLFQNWLAMPPMEKARSFIGTARRILKRKYYKKTEIDQKASIGRA
jgi:coenzyme F420 hydrogenase subunit beta